MTFQRRQSLVAGTLALAAAAAAAVVGGDSSSPDHAAPRRVEFQSLMQGLGAGAAVDLAHCACGFDLRLGTGCSQRDGPIPCGDFLCSGHPGFLNCGPRPAPAGMAESDTTRHAATR
jgi:hypothetical protein